MNEETIDECTIDDAALAHASGGMKWQQFRRSSNVEDVRGRGAQPASPPAPSGPDLSRSRMARDAGINDIGRSR